MKVLLFGGSGRLGSALAGRLTPMCDLYAPTHEELDITDSSVLLGALDEYHPNVVVNCAAMTDTGRCEVHQDEAFDVNDYPLVWISRWCNDNGAKLVHMSTDYVFGGYDEATYPDGIPNAYWAIASAAHIPMTIYGISKSVAEARVAECNDYHIIRTSNLFGGNGRTPTFMEKILGVVHEGKDLCYHPPLVVNSNYTSPTYVQDLAEAVVPIVMGEDIRDPDGHLRPTGPVEHIVSGRCTNYEFARMILEAFGWDTTIVEGEYPSPVVHPSVLLRPSVQMRPLKDALSDHRTTGYYRDLTTRLRDTEGLDGPSVELDIESVEFLPGWNE